MSVLKSFRGSRRTRRSTVSTELGHYIYCVNFYDNGLRAVRDEFMKRVISGTRRAVFVIDLDKEVAEAAFQNEILARKQGKLLRDFSQALLITSDQDR